MSTSFENNLLSDSVSQWQVRQVIVLDWYDGMKIENEQQNGSIVDKLSI